MTTEKMTIEKLKAEHPEAFAAAVKIGVEQENDRVRSCLVFQEIDPAGVKVAIESGKALSETQKAEFALKALSKKETKKIEETNTEVVKTAAEIEDDAKKAEKSKKEADFLAAAGFAKK